MAEPHAAPHGDEVDVFNKKGVDDAVLPDIPGDIRDLAGAADDDAVDAGDAADVSSSNRSSTTSSSSSNSTSSNSDDDDDPDDPDDDDPDGPPAPPPAPHGANSETWGQFVIAKVNRLNKATGERVHVGWGASCLCHKDTDGPAAKLVCQKQITGTSDADRRRLMKWLLKGADITDATHGARQRTAHVPCKDVVVHGPWSWSESDFKF